MGAARSRDGSLYKKEGIPKWGKDEGEVGKDIKRKKDLQSRIPMLDHSIFPPLSSLYLYVHHPHICSSAQSRISPS
jgi:hypothetical protein